MKFEISKEQLNNILVFLDRVQYAGLKENQALNEILSIFNNPIKENKENG